MWDRQDWIKVILPPLTFFSHPPLHWLSIQHPKCVSLQQRLLESQRLFHEELCVNALIMWLGNCYWTGSNKNCFFRSLYFQFLNRINIEHYKLLQSFRILRREKSSLASRLVRLKKLKFQCCLFSGVTQNWLYSCTYKIKR